MISLVCPLDLGPLTLRGREAFECPSCGASYYLRDGIPRFAVGAMDPGQAQVKDAFGFKWTRDEWGFKPEHLKVMRDFFWQRFGFSSEADVERGFGGKVVLHAGIGSGQIEQHYLRHSAEVWGVDISESVDACCRNWDRYYPDLASRLHLAQADLMAMPFQDETFDVVLSDGVLHHTPDTFQALRAVAQKARKGGVVIFYVYRKKAPIREFVDDYVRGLISDLPPHEAWARLEPLTRLARDLSRQKSRITIPDAVDLLGFPEGEFDLQRWLYWNVMKFYWNEALSFDENNHVNFDWYYPRYAWRHTPEEVREWLERLRLAALHFQAGDSGISVIARKG